MTRINVIPVGELTDQHLLAEARELPRIPNAILKGRYNLSGMPSEYTLGQGHVKMFYTRLGFLKRRYDQLHRECLERGFNVEYRFPEGLPAVTYHIANDTMAKHGDTILEYIEDCLGELPDVTGQSWSGMAVLFFSTAVELLASDIEARLEEIEDSE